MGTTHIRWATLAALALFVAACDTLGEPIEDVDGMKLQSGVVDLDNAPEALQEVSCVDIVREGTNQSFNGSPPSDHWVHILVENSRADVIVGSGNDELEHRIFTATFFAEREHEIFEIETLRGQHLRFGFWGSNACDSAPPSGLPNPIPNDF